MVRGSRRAWFSLVLLGQLAASNAATAAAASTSPRAASAESGQTPNRSTKPRAHRFAPAKPAPAPAPPAKPATPPTKPATAPAANTESARKAPRSATLEAAQNAAQNGEAAPLGAKTYHFDAEEVEGRLRSPQILYFLRRVRAQFDPEPLGHRSFLLELSDTRRTPALW